MITFYNKVLDIMLNGNRYEAIVYEDACFQRGVAIYNFNAQKGMLQLVAESFNIPFIGYPPATVKKAFTGSGKAKKPDMIKKANEVRLDTIKNDNEADAIGVYHTHLLLGDK
jgi:Holliday junction resolvasome RuvABC endonuclease subunit